VVTQLSQIFTLHMHDNPSEPLKDFQSEKPESATKLFNM